MNEKETIETDEYFDQSLSINTKRESERDRMSSPEVKIKLMVSVKNAEQRNATKYKLCFFYYLPHSIARHCY